MESSLVSNLKLNPYEVDKACAYYLCLFSLSVLVLELHYLEETEAASDELLLYKWSIG